MKLASNLGMLLLGVYLIVVGALPLLKIALPEEIPRLLAVAAGVLILMNK